MIKMNLPKKPIHFSTTMVGKEKMYEVSLSPAIFEQVKHLLDTLSLKFVCGIDDSSRYSEIRYSRKNMTIDEARMIVRFLQTAGMLDG